MGSAHDDALWYGQLEASRKKAEDELHAVLKALLYHYGPEGTNKVVTSALDALATEARIGCGSGGMKFTR
jgi:hypothetical protein